MKPTQILRLSFVSLILVMAISVGQSANGKTPDVNDILKSAQNGDHDAQVRLGLMYDKGEGVSQDYHEAFKWFTKAAEQGNARAQLNLGIMYNSGEGVEEDYVEAYKWAILAVAYGDPLAVKFRNALSQKMSPQQIAEAQSLAKEF